MHISLYRKYRSQSFDEIVGQNAIISTLKNAIKTGKIAHAYLFSGPRGTGKTSTARIFAKAINCENRVGVNPCNKCEQCKKITLGTAVNVIEIDAASNRGIENIRDIRDKIAYKSIEGKYKVYIIDEVHMLTNESFNAILKTLEEPPADTFFILATTEPHKVPITISSRCQRFDFGRISSEDVIKQLKNIAQKENLVIEEEAYSLIARACEGSLRDAISLLDQLSSYTTGIIKTENVIEVLGTSEPQFVFDLAEELINGQENKALALADKAVLDGTPSAQIIKDLLLHFRNMLIVKTDVIDILDLPKEQIDQLKVQSQKLSLEEIKEVVRILNQFDTEMKYHSTPRLLLDIAIFEVCDKRKNFAKNKGENVDKSTSTSIEEKNNFHNQINTEVLDDLTIIKTNWQTILEKMKTKSPFCYVSLSEAEPFKMERNGKLVIRFKKGFSFHKSRAEEPKNKMLLEECIKNVAGRDVSVSCIIADTIQPSNESVANQSITISDVEEMFDGTLLK